MDVVQARPGRRGVSLVEVIIALLVAGSLLSIAIQRGSTMSSRYQLSVTTEQIAADLQRARLEAIRRNTPVTFTRIGTTQYQVTGMVARTLPGGIFFDSLAPASVQFSSRGRLAGTPSNFRLRLGSETRQVNISSGGALAIP